MAFSNKKGFKDTGSVTHSSESLTVQNGSLYVYYVQCEDNATLKQSGETTVSFLVSTPSSFIPETESPLAQSPGVQLAAVMASIDMPKPWPMFMPFEIIKGVLGL
jgi:hypothetical protein